MQDSFRIDEVSFGSPGLNKLRVQIATNDRQPSNHLTAVTGRNGVGKSRLLSQIASVFEALSGAKPRSNVDATIEYSAGSAHCEVSLVGARITARLDGDLTDPRLMPAPQRVAAVTASAFDKFHIPRISAEDKRPPSSRTYRYLGLKDSRGRISATAGLYRALDELFDSVASDRTHRSRIGDVFRDLGYEPRIEVQYDWTSRGGALVKTGSDLGQQEYRAFSTPTRQSDAWIDRFSPEARETMVHELARAVELIGEIGTGREGALVADFLNPTLARIDHLQAAQLLRRSEMIRTKTVALFRLDSGDRVKISDASSGEIALVTAMLGIASAIDNGSLILIDEPEISLHPEWQSGYASRLLSAFDVFHGCHFIIATHSPLIVAGLPEANSNVVSLEKPRADALVGGRSVDEVLVRSFGMAGPDNLFLKQSLVRALRMASDRRFNDPEFTELFETLRLSGAAAGVAPEVRALIEDLGSTVARARQGPSS